MFTATVLIIALISIVWAFWSLRKLFETKEIDEAKKDLKKNKIIFVSKR